jgi:predicted dienelactone hydrolase
VRILSILAVAAQARHTERLLAAGRFISDRICFSPPLLGAAQAFSVLIPCRQPRGVELRVATTTSDHGTGLPLTAAHVPLALLSHPLLPARVVPSTQVARSAVEPKRRVIERG